MNIPLISVLIPCFNSVAYVAETIQSVISQTYKNWELIIVDDGSTDGSPEVIRKYINNKIKIFTQPNGGAAKARNLAFSHSQGDYIQYLDADDILSPNKLENQLKKLQKSRPDSIASCRWGRFKTSISNSIVTPSNVWKDYDNPINFLIECWEGFGMMVSSGWLVPRKIIETAGPWNESITLNDDGEYFCRVLLNTGNIIFVKDAMVYYRSGISNSLSRQRNIKDIHSAYRVCELNECNILAKENSGRVRHALMRNYLFFIYQYHPREKELIESAKKHINNLGFNKLELAGGKNFQRIAKIIGIENTLKLRALFKRYER